MSTLDEIRDYVLDARARCVRGINRENQRTTLTGKPNPSKLRIGSFERGIAKYDRWLAQLDHAASHTPPEGAKERCPSDVSAQGAGSAG